VVIAFALAAAALFGSADFLGGVASRRARAASVLVISAPAGVLVIFGAAMLSGAPFQTAGLGWALAAGAAGGAGLIIFYGALAAGPMIVVAPVSALVSTVVPVAAALAMGERASGAVYAGAALCLVAIVLVSLEGMPGGSGGPGAPVRPTATAPRRHMAARGLGYGAASGLAFGIFFLFIRNAGTSGVLWPVCMARVAGSLIILGAAAWLGTRPAGPGAGRWVLPAAVAAGVLDASANVCYVLAARAGLFGMAVVITSLYPGITVLLARVVLGERMRAVQRIGLALAAAGVAIVTF
jgi:drug/metabolite transporter (DMT)-like permease